MQRLKSTSFYQLTLLFNNHILMSYLIGIYLESWFSWLGGGVQKTLKNEENRQQKHWKMKRNKNEEYKESQITTINIFVFTFYIKNIFC